MTDSAKALALVNDTLRHLDAGTALAQRLRAAMESIGGDTQPPAPTPPVQPPAVDTDGLCYLNRYDDVMALARKLKAAREWPLDVTAAWHFKHWGKAEGRRWGCAAEAPAASRERFHHYNASAWEDRGVAAVLCPGDHAESVSIGGKALRRHGNLDKGREVWADYRTRGLTGTLRIVIDGTAYESEITDGHGMTQGDCWGSRGSE